MALETHQRAQLGCWLFLWDSRGAGAEQGEKHRSSAFTNNELHPFHRCTHSSAEHSGPKPSSSPSAKLSHLGRPFRLQLSDCSTAHLSFGGCFYPKCPTDPQVFTFLAWVPQGKWNPWPLQWLPNQYKCNKCNKDDALLHYGNSRWHFLVTQPLNIVLNISHWSCWHLDLHTKLHCVNTGFSNNFTAENQLNK